MKKLIALGLGLAAFSFNASAATLGPGDLVAIEETFKENEIRFKRDYAEKEFAGHLAFRRARAHTFDDSKFSIEFGTGGFTSDANCWITDPKVLDFVISLNKGEMVYVEGVVDDVTMGSVELKACKIRHS